MSDNTMIAKAVNKVPYLLTKPFIGQRVVTADFGIGAVTAVDNDVAEVTTASGGKYTTNRLNPLGTVPRHASIVGYTLDGETFAIGRVMHVKWPFMIVDNAGSSVTVPVTQWYPEGGWATWEDVSEAPEEYDRDVAFAWIVERLNRISRSDWKFRMDVADDMQTISQAIAYQKEQRGWCDEAWDVVNGVNDDLKVLEIAIPSREVDVEWDEEVLVTIRRSGTFTVESWDDPCDVARMEAEDADTSEILDAVRNGNYETTDKDNFEEV